MYRMEYLGRWAIFPRNPTFDFRSTILGSFEPRNKLSDVAHKTLIKQFPTWVQNYIPWYETSYPNPPATEDTKAMDCEIESRQGIGW
jgi:hypothetical protein